MATALCSFRSSCIQCPKCVQCPSCSSLLLLIGAKTRLPDAAGGKEHASIMSADQRFSAPARPTETARCTESGMSGTIADTHSRQHVAAVLCPLSCSVDHGSVHWRPLGFASQLTVDKELPAITTSGLVPIGDYPLRLVPGDQGTHSATSTARNSRLQQHDLRRPEADREGQFREYSPSGSLKRPTQ